MRRRSAANQQSAGVSLFPFLAVLLCTMGALIVVLVVIARHAHLQVAEAARRAAAAAASSGLATQREDLEWRISELKKSRAATKKLLDDKQLELSHIEEHTRRIRDKLDELASAQEHFHEMAAGDAKENDALKARLARLRGDADRTKAQIKDLRAKAGSGSDSYAIIPYHGPNETFRRPIYVECRKEGVVLQPEGIVLTEDDFAVDLGPSNPLVSALRAARDYHARNQLMHRTEATTPYPLFIIRPDGIEMSYLARAAMVSWGPEFGYELIGQDWPLEYPPPEPMLAMAMKQAVSEGRMRQAFIARAAPALSRTGSHATFRASAHGGITQVDGSPVGGGRRGSGRPRGMPGRRGIGGGDLGGGELGGRERNGGVAAGDFAGSSSSQGDGPVRSLDGGDNPYERALATTPPSGRYGRGPGGFAGNYSGQPGRYGGAGAGGYLPGAAMPAGAAGRGNGAYGDGAGGGQGQARNGPPGSRLAATRGAGTGDGFAGGGGPGGGGSGDGMDGALGDARGKTQGKGPASGGGAADGPDAGQTGGGTRLAQAGPSGGPGGAIVNGSFGHGVGGGNASSAGRSGNSQQNGATGEGTAATGAPGGADGKIPSNTGATAPGGPYRMAVSGSNTKGPSGPGNSAPAGDSDPTGNAADGTSADGLNVPASPNGFASGRTVRNAQENSQAGNAKKGNGGNADAGSADPTVLSESRGIAGGNADGSFADGNSAGGGSSAGGPGKSRGQSAGGTSSGASGSSGSNSSMASGQPSGAGGSASSMQSQQGGPSIPMPNFDLGQRNPQAPESIAKKRDRNWANPDASTSNIPIERPIRIVCDAEHLTLLPEGRGRQGMRIIPFKRRTVESVDDLVSTVWDRIDSWGTAGRGMYWRPVLLMEVEPGGQRRYAELQALLADSGFDIHGKPRRHIIVAPRGGSVRQR